MKKKHPDDRFYEHLDRALNGCLRELAPYLGKPIDADSPEDLYDPEALYEAMQQHLHTHLAVELKTIWDGDGIEEVRDPGHGRKHIIERLYEKYGSPKAVYRRSFEAGVAGRFEEENELSQQAFDLAARQGVPESEVMS